MFRFDSSLPGADFQRAGVGQLWIDFMRFLWGKHFLAPSVVVFPVALPAIFLGIVSPAASLRARANLLLFAHHRTTLVDGLLRWLPEWSAGFKWMVLSTEAFKYALARLSHHHRTAQSCIEAHR